MKRVGKLFKWTGSILLAVIVIVVLVIGIIRAVHKSRTEIKTENGIQESGYVSLGGVEQYIQIRGENVNNPIIIFLHGGPGSNMTYISTYYQTGLEDEFTIVNWDQRGCGRTYFKNEDSSVSAELSIDTLLTDLDDLTDYVTERFGQEKVIIMGHSWGTIVGSQYVAKHPEKVTAYVGLGQFVNGLEGYQIATKEAANRALKQNENEDAAMLEEVFRKFSTATSVENLDIKYYEQMIMLTRKYLSYEGALSDSSMIFAGLTSPEMSWLDVQWFQKMSNTESAFHIEEPLMNYCIFDLDMRTELTQYEVPMFYISGAQDYVTPVSLMEEYVDAIKAPEKKVILVENTGHSLMMDNSNAFCDAVKGVLIQ